MAAFLMLWLTLLIARGTAIGQYLHSMMVERPAKSLDRVRRVHIVLAIVIVGLVVLHLFAGDDDPVRMLALVAPDLAVSLASLEFGALVDIAILGAAGYAAFRRSPLGQALSVRCVPRRANRGRAPRRPARPSSANDDPEHAGFALAS